MSGDQILLCNGESNTANRRKDNAINKSYPIAHFKLGNHLEKNLILSFDPIFKLFRYFLSLFLFLDNLSHGMYNYFFYVFCADYWQTLSFWQIILIRLSQIVNAFEISLFSTLPFAKQIVCFHLNVFSVVYCVYCCIVS